MTAERDILRRVFSFPASADVELGIGDDAAVTRASGRLALCADAMVCGRHFFPDADPFLLGKKALAVSVSDLAAMGARPLWALAVLAAERRHGEKWMAELARGMRARADSCGFAVIGGDLTASATTVISTTLAGECDGGFLTRSGAAAGDDVWLSGETGEAALALRLRGGGGGRENKFGWKWDVVCGENRARAFARMDDPTPRVGLGRRLVGLASAALDVSDGLMRAALDLALASGIAVRLDAEKLPPAPALAELEEAARTWLMLEGGDDYELLFCAPPEMRERIEAAGAAENVRVSRIGTALARGNEENEEDEEKGQAGKGEVNVFWKGARMSGEALPQGYEHDFGE